MVEENKELKETKEVKEKKIGVGFGIIVIKDNKILLGKRHDDPEKASSLLNGAGTWTMPGGKLKFGESFEEGAIRELKEETGLEVGQYDLKVMGVNNDVIETAHFVTMGLICENIKGEPKVLEPDQITEWKWFALEDLPYPIYVPSAKLLDKYRKNAFYLRGQ